MRKTPTSGRALRLLVGVSALSVLLSGSMTARPPSDPPVYALWTPMATYKPSPTPMLAPEPEIILEPAWVSPEPPQRVVRQQPKVEVETRAPRERALPVSGASITGKASWYCSPSQPICHYAYPPGSMVAAACGKLRRAMGPGWRGNVVRVTRRGGASVNVRLVDWCGSEDKLIDLYWEPMRQLGGTGVLRVTVAW